MLILSLLICHGLQDIKYLVLLPKQWRHFQNYELSEKKSEILQTKCLRGEGIFFFYKPYATGKLKYLKFA